MYAGAHARARSRYEFKTDSVGRNDASGVVSPSGRIGLFRSEDKEGVMLERFTCLLCQKTFRGQGGLDWHQRRFGHTVRDSDESVRTEKVDAQTDTSSLSDAVESLERKIVNATSLYSFYEALGKATPVPQHIIDKLRDLADRLESTRR